MKGSTESVRLALETLTPLHVGSGVELQREMDFVERSGTAFVVDQNRTFEAVAAGDAAADTLLRTSRLSDLVQLAGAYHGYSLSPLAGSGAVPSAVRGCMKDAFFNPYVPGSSLKGAIRTALLAQWLRTQGEAYYQDWLPTGQPDRRDPTRVLPSARAQFAAQALTQQVFSGNAPARQAPNRDLLRVLHVGDAGFEPGVLRLADIRWLNLYRDGSRIVAGWRDMGSRKNVQNWQTANGIYVEALSAGSVAPVMLQWDRFLLSDLGRWQAPAHAAALLPADFPALCRVLNDHARYELQQEIEFFTTYQVQTPLQHCRRLLTQVDAAQQAAPPDTAYLRLAWGSGWRGMTGDWLTESQAVVMRELYRLGRRGLPFPKTRRLAVQGSPCLPLGWVRLMPWDAARVPVAPTRSPENSAGMAWVESQLAQIQQAHRCPADEALRGQALGQAWQALTDPSLKTAALAAIRARWQTKGWWDQPSGKTMKKARTIYQEET